MVIFPFWPVTDVRRVPQTSVLRLGLGFTSTPSCIRRGSSKQLSPFAAPNSRSPPKFDHSLLFTSLRTYTRATLAHGRPIPAQVSKLHPCVPAPPHRRSLPLLTTHHSLPNLLTKRRREGPSFPTCRPSNVTTLLFTKACRLFVVSLHSFPHSFPLFLIVCSLFSQNTRVGGTEHAGEGCES